MHTAPNGSIIRQQSQTIRNTVTAQSEETLTIEADYTYNSESYRTVYKAPIKAVQLPTPGRSSLANNKEQFVKEERGTGPDKRPFNNDLIGTTENGWFTSTTNTITGGSSGTFVLKVELVERRGGARAEPGKNLWLLPSLMSSADGVTVISSTKRPIADAPLRTSTGVQTLSSEYTGATRSYLANYDNPQVNARLWYSYLYSSAWTSNGQFVPGNWNYSLDAQATSPFGNWYRDNVSWGAAVPDPSYAYFYGDADFRGAFPLGTISGWYGDAHQRHWVYVNSNYMHTYGSVWAYDSMGGFWFQWNSRDCINQWYGNNSNILDYWYINGDQPPCP